MAAQMQWLGRSANGVNLAGLCENWTVERFCPVGVDSDRPWDAMERV